MNISELTRFKIMLLARKEELQEFQTASLIVTTQPVELDQTTVARLPHIDAMQNQQMTQETQRRRQSELEQVEGALRRITLGDYGYCLKCDEEMDQNRLEANPTLTHCINCAANKNSLAIK